MNELSLDDMLKLAEKVSEWNKIGSEYKATIELNPAGDGKDKKTIEIHFDTYAWYRRWTGSIEVRNDSGAVIGQFSARQKRKLFSDEVLSEPGSERLKEAYKQVEQKYFYEGRASPEDVKKYLGGEHG